MKFLTEKANNLFEG